MASVRSSTVSRYEAAGGPGDRAERERRVGVELAAALAEAGAVFVAQTAHVAPRRPDAGAERRPPVLERRVHDVHAELGLGHVLQAGRTKQLPELAAARA